MKALGRAKYSIQLAPQFYENNMTSTTFVPLTEFMVQAKRRQVAPKCNL